MNDPYYIELVEAGGFEPPTTSLQVMCFTNISYAPVKLENLVLMVEFEPTVAHCPNEQEPHADKWITAAST